MKRFVVLLVLLSCLVAATCTVITPSAHAASLSQAKPTGMVFIGTRDTTGHMHYVNPKYIPRNIVTTSPFSYTPCCIYRATCGAPGGGGFAKIVSNVDPETQCFARSGCLSIWVSNTLEWTAGNNSPAYVYYSPDGLNWYEDYIPGDYQWHNLPSGGDVDYICLQ